MFTQWATRRLFKFLLKKRIGCYIKGDLDLEQLDVQLGSGVVQLNDLSLHTEYINEQLADSSLVLKEGSVGSVTVKLQWKVLATTTIEIELDELELVFSPRLTCRNASSSSNSNLFDDPSAVENQHAVGLESELAGLASSGGCTYVPVQEGVRVVANLVESLLLGMHIRIRGAIIAFEEQPRIQHNSHITQHRGSHSMLVVRVGYAEYGVDYTGIKDSCKREESDRTKLAILSKAVEFKDVVLGLVDILSENTGGGKVYGQPVSILPYDDRLSGRIQLSIPWKCGSLDIPKLNADIDISQVKLWVTGQQLQHLLDIAYSFGDRSNGDMGGTQSFVASQNSALHHSVTSAKASEGYNDRGHSAVPLPNDLVTVGMQSRFDRPGLLPGTRLISDWVHWNNGDSPSKEEAMSEADFAASTEEFFDCFDGTRSSQASLSNSGLWTWTCSAFSAITAASSLAYGSVLISQDSARRVEYEIKIKVVGVSFKVVEQEPNTVWSSDDLVSSISNILKDKMRLPEKTSDTMHPDYTGEDHIEACLSDVDFSLQASQRRLEWQLLVSKVELFEVQSSQQDALSHSVFSTISSSTQSLQDLIEEALPPFPVSFNEVNTCQRQTEQPFFCEDKLLTATPALDKKLPVKKCFLRMLDSVHVPARRMFLRANYASTSASRSSESRSQGRATAEIHLQPLIVWFDVLILDKLQKLVGIIGRPTNDFRAGDCATNTSGMDYTSKTSTLVEVDIHIPCLRLLACIPVTARPTFVEKDMLCVDLVASTKDAKRPLLSLQLFDGFQEKRTPSCDVSIGFAFEHSNLYLVSAAATKMDSGTGSLGFTAEKAIYVSMPSYKMASLDISFRGKSSAGVGLAERAWSGVKEQQKGGMGGSNSEFAAATATEMLGENNSRIREDMLACSSTRMHVTIPPVNLELFGPQHSSAFGLASCLMQSLPVRNSQPHETSNFPSGVRNSIPDLQQQISVLVEVEEVEIVHHPLVNDERFMPDHERKGYHPWDKFRILVTKFQALQVSNLESIKDANYLWLSSEGVNISGSVVDGNVGELSLLTCKNDALGRGDGGGGNALATRSAGIGLIVSTWPDRLHDEDMLIIVTIRGGTFLAHGGQLDWLPGLITMFSQPSRKVIAGQAIYERAHCSRRETLLVELQCGESKTVDVQSEDCVLFSLDLHDVALCYEPGKEALAAGNMRSRGMTEAQASNLEQFAPVACALAAAAVRVSSNAISSTPHKEYELWIRDIALLLVDTTLRKKSILDYSPETLHQAGYVKVAREAVMEAVVRISSEEGIRWEVECANNQLRLDTCHDTTAALGRLIAQLQQLFAPDFEHSSIPSQLIESYQQFEAGHIVKGVEREQGDSPNPSVARDDKITVFEDMLEDAFTFVRDPSLCTEPSLHGIPVMVDAEAVKGEMLSRFEVLGTSFSSDDAEDSLGNSADYLYGDGEAKDFWTPISQQDGFPSFIEDHYVTSKSSLLSSQSSGCKDSGGFFERSQRSADNSNLVSTIEGSGGWYEGHTLNILENHVAPVSKSDQNKQRGSLSHSPTSVCSLEINTHPYVGRVLLRDLNLRWRLYGGSDWSHSRIQDFSGFTQAAQGHSGRQADVCLQVILNGVELKHETFPQTGSHASRLSVCIRDVGVYDCSKMASWKKVLGYHISKSQPRESFAKALKLELESVRPNPAVPLEEYRLTVHLSPLVLHLDQRHLDFLVGFFPSSGIPSAEIYEGASPPNVAGSEVSLSETKAAEACEPALLPFFQMCELQPFTIRVDYVPRRVDIGALRGGNYAELFNLVSWKGIELQLKHVHAAGIHGWGTLSGIVVGEWLEDISHNQVHKLVKGLGPIRPLFAVGSGAAKLIVLPAEHYKKDRRHLLRGMKKGAIAFLRSISVETIGVGVKLAAGAQGILLHTESALGSVALPSPIATERVEISGRVGQPGDVREGLQQACESLTRGFERTVSSLIGNPMKVYQRGAGTSSAVASALLAAPAAAVAPASGVAGAVHRALLGVRNSLDPEHRRESEEKHSGPPPD